MVLVRVICAAVTCARCRRRMSLTLCFHEPECTLTTDGMRRSSCFVRAGALPGASVSPACVLAIRLACTHTHNTAQPFPLTTPPSAGSAQLKSEPTQGSACAVRAPRRCPPAQLRRQFDSDRWLGQATQYKTAATGTLTPLH